MDNNKLKEKVLSFVPDAEVIEGKQYLEVNVAPEKLHELASEYLEKNHVKDLEQRMTAEDFAYFAEKVPSCLYRLGIANKAKGISSNLHSATFDIDEQSIGTGMGLMAWFAVNLLRN